MRALHTTIWTLVSEGEATLSERCTSCGKPQPLVCTGKFRVNAHRRRIDVWLLFHCPQCQATLKQTVLERMPVNRIPARDLLAYQNNDPALAQEIAVRMGATVPFRIEGRIPPPPFVAIIEGAMGTHGRVDRLIANAMGWSRSYVIRSFKAGLIHVEGGIRQRIRDGLQIEVATSNPECLES